MSLIELTGNVSMVGTIAAAVAFFVLGAIWYHPKVLGARWAELSGVESADMDMGDPDTRRAMAIQGVSNLVMAWVLAIVLTAIGAVTMTAAVLSALVLWFGFNAMTMLAGVAFQGHPWGLWGINAGYHGVGFILMAIVYVLLA